MIISERRKNGPTFSERKKTTTVALLPSVSNLTGVFRKHFLNVRYRLHATSIKKIVVLTS